MGIASIFPCSCSSFGMHKDVTKEIIRKLNPNGDVPWRFFKHSESENLFAENVDETDVDGFTALHHATYENLLEIAKALIEAHVDVNAQTRYGFTALHIAAIKNRLEIGKMLIDAGASVYVRNAHQNTPLDSANGMLWRREEFIKMVQKQNLKSGKI